MMDLFFIQSFNTARTRGNNVVCGQIHPVFDRNLTSRRLIRSAEPMDSKKTILLSLRIDPEVARAFKIEAAKRGVKLNTLFEDLFRAYMAAQEAATNAKKRRGADG